VLRTSQNFGVGILSAVSMLLKDIQRDAVNAVDKVEWACAEIARARIHEDYSGCFLWLGASHDFLIDYVGIARAPRLEVEFNALKAGRSETHIFSFFSFVTHLHCSPLCYSILLSVP